MYCKNISLWEGVLVLISTIFLYIWMLLQEYFTLGGCAGLDIYNIFVYLTVQEYFTLRGCAGLDIYNIFVYLTVIARIHFERVCWSWYLQYFCIFECYCKNISLWEGVLVLISTIFLYICICYCKNISLWEGVLVLKSTISLYICILACYCKNISLWEGVLALKGQIYRRNYNNMLPTTRTLSCPFSCLHLRCSVPTKLWQCKVPTTMRHEVREQDRGQNEGQNRGQNRGQNEGRNRGKTGAKRHKVKLY